MADLYTEADVELAARALFDAECRVTDPATWEWNLITEDDRESYRRVQRAALEALTADGWRKPPDVTGAYGLVLGMLDVLTEGDDSSVRATRIALKKAEKILRPAASPSIGEDRTDG